MVSLNTVRSIKVSYISEGAEKFKADAQAAASAQDNLGQATERTAVVTETASRRMLSVSTATDRVRASVDLAFRSQQQLERQTATLSRGLQQGALDTATYDRTLGLLQARFGASASAADRAAAAWKNLGAAGDAVSRAMTPVGRLSGLSSDGSVPVRPGMATPTAANQNGRLRADQAQNLLYQGGDIVAQLGSGSGLGMIAMQQGPQIAQVFAGPGGASVKGALSQAGEAASGFLGRIGLVGGAIGGVTALALTGAAAWISYSSSQKELERNLAGVGRASEATGAAINALAPAAAEAGNVSIRSARQMAGEYAATGKIGTEMYVGLIGSAKDYAATTGQDLSDANKALAAAFADPAKGAEALNSQLGFLNDRTSETIRRLQAQGDRLGAQRVLFDAYKASLTDAADMTTAWGRISAAALQPISDIWDEIGRRIDKAVTGGSLEDQIEAARKVLAESRELQTSAIGRVAGGIFGQDPVADQRKLDELLAKQRRQQEAATRAGAAARSREIGGIVRELDPTNAAFNDTQNRVETLRKAISDPVKFGLDTGLLAQARTAFEQLSTQARSTREDIERFGSPAVAAANRQARSENQLATDRANPVERQIADLRFQYDEKIRALNIAPGATRETISQPFNERMNNPNFDSRELQAIALERNAALRPLTEREGLTENLNLAIDSLKKTTEAQATRSQNVSSYMERAMFVESGGKTDAKNPLSTATGLGQFIEGTWLPLFKQAFPDRATGMSDREILSRRTDRDDSVAVLRLFTEQNSRFLEKQSIATTDRNLYLAHFAGAQGAVDLLKADRGTSAESILGRKAALANPTIIGGGRTAGDVIDYAGRVITKGAPAIRTSEREVATLRQQATLTDQTTEAEARRQKIQELLNEDMQRAGDLGRTFATSQDLLKASASQLTPEMETQRKVIIETAEAYAKAQANLENSRIGREALFDRAQMGRTQQEQSVASRLRGTGLGLDSVEADALRLNDNLRETKSLATDAFSSMLTDLRQGTTLAKSLETITGRLADKLLSKAADSVMSNLFAGLGSSGMGGSGGGFGSMIANALGLGGGAGTDIAAASARGASNPALYGPGFASGGYTGAGGRNEVAGPVHKGEYVFDAAATARIGVASLEAMRTNRRGWADGGYVGNAPTWMAPPANAPQQIVFAPNIIPPDGYRAETKEVDDGRGGRKPEITFAEITAQGIRSPQGQQALGQRRVARR
ncbi:phage tail length tape measure family protein [Methylobacterium sp. CM6247]